jgi:hypothetical protein
MLPPNFGLFDQQNFATSWVTEVPQEWRTSENQGE